MISEIVARTGLDRAIIELVAQKAGELRAGDIEQHLMKRGFGSENIRLRLVHMLVNDILKMRNNGTIQEATQATAG